MMKSRNKENTIAIFVKTPHVSPTKTRLGKTIGTDRAVKIYKLLLNVVQETVLSAKDLGLGFDPFWAVAEESEVENKVWNAFPVIAQPSGCLGERMYSVYNRLQSEGYQNVVLIGADSPLLSQEVLQNSFKALQKYDFVLGPASDGGFYLFGGSRSIDLKSFKDVEYSTESTYKQFFSNISSYGKIKVLEEIPDFDYFSDLKVHFKILRNKSKQSLTNSQILLLDELGKLDNKCKNN